MTSKHPIELLCLTSIFAVIVLPGCGSSDFRIADVSGVVTMDGEPLSNARVQFQPQRSGDSLVVGPTSFGTTDSDGKFVLKTRKDGDGAVVGPHLVSLSTFDQQLVDPKKSDRVEVLAKERVPARYRAPTELTFDVPSRGTSEANFDLRSK